MTEICEHDTFKNICGICHRDGLITKKDAEITRLRAVLREIAKPWTARSLSVADLRQAVEMVIAELERRRAVAEAALGGEDK